MARPVTARSERRARGRARYKRTRAAAASAGISDKDLGLAAIQKIAQRRSFVDWLRVTPPVEVVRSLSHSPADLAISESTRLAVEHPQRELAEAGEGE